jgi:integrase/recombinase XerD
MSDLIEAHIEHMQLSGEYSDRTIADRKKILHRLHDHLPLGLAYADTDNIRAFLARPGWSRWTRCTYDMHIRSAYHWWCDNGYQDGNPVTWPAPKRPRLVPRPATDAALVVALGLPEPVRTAVLFAAYEGLRASEICEVHRDHITEATLWIPRGKGGDSASVITHPIVWAHVHQRDGWLVRHHRTGERVDGHWLSEIARRWFARAGLTTRLHGLRHWHATTLLARGANLRTVQECMRHASIASTAGYTKVVDEQRRAAVLALPIPEGTRASR